MDRAREVAAAEIPVLLVGEHGVGKDLLARAIHALSPRRQGPFVSEVCAIPESLLESELFGYVRGAFTDAVEDRPGLLQLGRGGTLYLDEVSELSPALQARLVKVLSEKRARPIGAVEPVPIDLRLISSTRRPLRDLEDSGALRDDLFYRIRGEVLEVPPLRERREDVPLLLRHFADACSRERGHEPPEIDADLVSSLSAREWPGNVRQLENEVRRALHLSPGRLTREAFDRVLDRAPGGGTGWGPRASGPPEPLRDARLAFEREHLTRVLSFHSGNASRAARTLRVTRRYLGMLIDKHGLKLRDFARKHGETPGNEAPPPRA